MDQPHQRVPPQQKQNYLRQPQRTVTRNLHYPEDNRARNQQQHSSYFPERNASNCNLRRNMSGMSIQSHHQMQNQRQQRNNLGMYEKYTQSHGTISQSE